MKFLQHAIADSEIIGLSPIMRRINQDGITSRVYYFFHVYLRHHTILLESETARIHDAMTDADKSEQFKPLEEFKAKYFEIRPRILQLAGEE